MGRYGKLGFIDVIHRCPNFITRIIMTNNITIPTGVQLVRSSVSEFCGYVHTYNIHTYIHATMNIKGGMTKKTGNKVIGELEKGGDDRTSITYKKKDDPSDEPPHEERNAPSNRITSPGDIFISCVLP
mmetsp:Transcript_27151/g.30879  ORF Transcript_27151/g.30879 Transcript_27151/m.30879 type:complete len:128 (+) Transcript_27151:303-686(+)